MTALNLFLTLSWTVYAVFLPALFKQSGLPARLLLPLLMMDQALFAVSDVIVGIAADRVATLFKHAGRGIVLVGFVSCAAFILIPLAAGASDYAGYILIASTITWTVTSAALRVPLLMLLARHSTNLGVPRLAVFLSLGLGLAGLAAPTITASLRTYDPRLAFALSSLALYLSVLVTIKLADPRPNSASSDPALRPVPRDAVWMPAVFVAAILLLALGFQIHVNLNSLDLYRRLMLPLQKTALSSAFWIGFNFAMIPAGALARRVGPLPLLAAAGLVGAMAIAVASISFQAAVLIGAQAIAGASWGVVMVTAFAGAILIGQKTGFLIGLTYSAFAIATFGRLFIAAAGPQAVPSGVRVWSPMVMWGLAGMALTLAIILRPIRRSAPKPALPV